MKQKLMLLVMVAMMLGVVFSINTVTWSFEKQTPIRISPDKVLTPFFSEQGGSSAYCLIQNDDGIARWYYGGFDSGMGVAVYMNPAKCTTHPTYPFKITDAHFYLYASDATYHWPVAIRFMVLDSKDGDSCAGPQGVLYSQDLSIPSDSADPHMINFSLDPPCCVSQPFFLEIMYTAPRDSMHPHPSPVMDTIVALADSCNNWGLWIYGSHYKWTEYWTPPPPGEPIIRATGYTDADVTDCDSCWYWKPDRPDQQFPAPSGIPDFDQYQFVPKGLCGPTAVANCLWWFNAVPDSVTPDSLIQLLIYYFHTHPDSGTYVDSIQSGLDRYFADFGFMLEETTYTMPDFSEMEDSLEKSQDIILLLGFWQQDGPIWHRVGGHFVTMAGVCSDSLWVALSDPAQDAAETGKPGRIRPPGHPIHPMGNILHNNPQFVSHDIYSALLGSPSPGGAWGLVGYDSVYQFEGQNFQPGQWINFSPYNPAIPTFTEVEYAVMICPKPSAVEEEEEGGLTPQGFELYQNYPNPFNPTTTIRFTVHSPQSIVHSPIHTTIKIYNILGQLVRTLVDEPKRTGNYEVIWDGRDEKGNNLVSGVYFYQLKAGEATQTKRLVLLK